MSTSTDAIQSVTLLMKSPAIKTHGPEHHFLVPAVLVSAFRNAGGRANAFAREHLGVEMGVDQAATRCVFYGLNRECKKKECSFYPL